MRRFFILKVTPYPAQPHRFFWAQLDVQSFDQLPPEDDIVHNHDISSRVLLAIMDLLNESYQLVDDQYEVLIRDNHNDDMLITNEGGWALAALTFV